MSAIVVVVSMKDRVTLTDEERKELRKKVSSGESPARELQHAQALLRVDTGGPCLSDAQAAEAIGVCARSVQRVRERYARQGLRAALGRKAQPPRPDSRKITDELEARLIALACEHAPEGRARWTLHLLAGRAVELGLVGSLSHESVRQVLKKTSFSLTGSSAG